MYKELWFIVREYSGKYFSRMDGERMVNKIMNINPALKLKTKKKILAELPIMSLGVDGRLFYWKDDVEEILDSLIERKTMNRQEVEKFAEERGCEVVSFDEDGFTIQYKDEEAKILYGMEGDQTFIFSDGTMVTAIPFSPVDVEDVE